MKMEQTECSET